MFEHPDIEIYEFDEVPLDQDIYLVDKRWMVPYEAMLIGILRRERDYEPVGYVACAAARKIDKDVIALSWFANINTRFHEVSVTLPRDAFVTCVSAWTCDEKPRIFVKSDWLEAIYLRSYSVFALIDAVDVKNALRQGRITKPKLLTLRTRIDEIAKCYPSISFISFADSLLLKSNWTVGLFESEVSYTYRPELFLEVIVKIRRAYWDTLGLKVYAVLAQGPNEYYDEPLLHISETRNHICLNSLAVPFAQLFAIEKAARKSIGSGDHEPGELYMDSLYYHSLRFEDSFDKWETPRAAYTFMNIAEGYEYFITSADVILQKIDTESTNSE